MSAPANPYHHGQAENFEKAFKIKAIYLAGSGKFDDVATRLRYFIEEICNKRMHPVLGYQAPTHFEARRFRQAVLVSRIILIQDEGRNSQRDSMRKRFCDANSCD